MACYLKKTSISPKADALIKAITPDLKVEAILWDGTVESLQQIKAMVGEHVEVGRQVFDLLAIKLTPHSMPYLIALGYWAVKYRPDLIAGCRPDIFQSTYQLVEE
jgi:hypothetical protein